LINVSLPAPPEFVRQRYNRLAPWYVLFEWILWLPRGIREAAVRRLELQPGERVLEVGCGTGRNLKYLEAAVGPDGHIFGVDLSEQMLARCRALCEKRRWQNVTLVRGDALEYTTPGQVDAILFSLSYCTMLHRKQILSHVWSQLRPGGRLVILEGKTIPGLLGRLLHPLIILEMKATVLGDPDYRAWEDVQALTNDVDVKEQLLGGYFTCRGRKGAP
jgi:ubiquinone/menaquinone biosynthesis C-methylase UbiE